MDFYNIYYIKVRACSNEEKRRKAFWHNIKFKYKLTIINENTLEEVVGIHVSKLNGLSVLLSVCTVIFLIAAAIIAFTPLRNYLPGYMNSEVRSQSLPMPYGQIRYRLLLNARAVM